MPEDEFITYDYIFQFVLSNGEFDYRSSECNYQGDKLILELILYLLIKIVRMIYFEFINKTLYTLVSVSLTPFNLSI